MAPKRIGILGCGDILGAYMVGLSRFGALATVERLAAVHPARAATAAERYSVRKHGTPDELWSDQEVDLVVSLTPPAIHHTVITAAAEAGKDIYTEKPLSATTALAAEALRAAADARITVGSAPDTFLGSAAQTARACIDRGDIGDVIAVTAFAPCSRAERRHPNPEFLFQRGAGPLLDMPPYHLTWLVHLLGAVERVIGVSKKSAPIRNIRTYDGRSIDVPIEIDTHVTSLLEFRSGVVGTFVASLDIWGNRLPMIEVYGSLGSLSLPGPYRYDGSVEIRLHDDAGWELVHPLFDPIQTHAKEKVRGLGVNDLIASKTSSSQRSSGALALHVLEVLEAMERSSLNREFVTIATNPERPLPVDGKTIDSWRTRVE